MNRIYYLALMLLAHLSLSAQNSWSASSPDRGLQIILTHNNGSLAYQVKAGNQALIKPSVLGLEAAGGMLDGPFTFVRTTSKPIRETYRMVTGKRRNNTAQANETTVTFTTSKQVALQITLRAYNDGVAFRYELPQPGKQMTITGEKTAFALNEGGKVWMQNYDIPTDYTPAYEGVFVNGIPIGQNATDSGGWALPALFQTAGHYLLISESNLGPNFFGSHLDSNSSGGVYRLTGPMQSEAKGFGNTNAEITTPFASPWRMIMIGKDLQTIVASNLVHHLAAPNMLGDVSWVKPGRSSWSWWGDHDSSKDFEKLKSFVDLAKEMGWEYSLVDANWNIMDGGTIQELVRYAASKNIGLLLWYNSGGPHNVVTEQPRDIMNDPQKRKAAFRQLRQWGVKGIKVDFFQSDKQVIIQQYHDILVDAAREKLLVNFHGCTLPRGWSRTYPNLVSMEAVRGAENYGWGKAYAETAPVHHNILTYTRNVIGPMDYTPVTFSGYDCCPRTTTHAHELALSVLFETGILHFADRAAPYREQSSLVKQFMRTVPVVWDDTRLVQGEPGKTTVLARRHGNTWYIAGANGENEAKVLNLQLPFLTAASYATTLYADGATPEQISANKGRLQKGKPMAITMLPNGGFVLVLTPAQ